MTNYNERLDEIFKRYSIYADTDYANYDVNIRYLRTPEETTQALTSLMKELVAEAKPKNNWLEGSDLFYGQDGGVGESEQNLLKALEEI